MIHTIDPLTQALGPWASELTIYAVVLRIVLSILFSAIIGCERSSKRHAAGLRTFILVSFASTLAMTLDLANGGAFYLSAATVIAIAIITVNSILYSSKNQIKGLTTSVGLWACGILGMTIGAGLYTVSIIAFIALIFSLSLFPAIEVYLKNRSNHFEIHVELTSPEHLQTFVSTIRQLGMTIDDIELNPAYAGSGLSVYSIAISISSHELHKYKSHQEIIEALDTLEYVRHIEALK